MVATASSPRVLVTGGTGYLGSKLATALFESGHKVVVLTRSRPVAADPRFEYVTHDGSMASVVAAFEQTRPQSVAHVAARYVRRHVPSDVEVLMEANVTLGALLLEAAVAFGTRRFVYAGSFFQHSGASDGSPRNLYAATKSAFEQILDFYESTGAIEAVRLTLCDVYGEDDPRPRFLKAAVSAALDESVLRVPREDPYLVPVHIDDVTAAFQTALSIADTGKVYWVGPAAAVKQSEIIALVSRLVGSTVKVERADLPALPGDTLAPVPGASLPDWLPSIILEEGIRRMIKFHRESGDHQQ